MLRWIHGVSAICPVQLNVHSVFQSSMPKPGTTVHQALGGAAGAAFACATYMIQVAKGNWDWVVVAAAQDIAFQGVEFVLPWILTAVLAIVAGVLGIRSSQAKKLAKGMQAFLAVALAILPVVAFVLAVTAS